VCVIFDFAPLKFIRLGATVPKKGYTMLTFGRSRYGHTVIRVCMCVRGGWRRALNTITIKNIVTHNL